jgi:hypothetical protein
MFIADPGIFNEEVCETALSQLAHSITRSPNLRVLEAANKTYKRLSLFATTCSGLVHETKEHESDVSLAPMNCIDFNGPEVRQTGSFLERMLSALSTNNYLQYDSTRPFVYAKDASLCAPVIIPRYFDIDLRAVLSANLQKFKKQQLVRFIFSDPDVAQYWPEYKGAEAAAQASRVQHPVLASAEDSDDEQKSSDREDEASGESEQSEDDEQSDGDEPSSNSAPPISSSRSIASSTSEQTALSRRISNKRRARNQQPVHVHAKADNPNTPLPSKRACAGRVAGNYVAANWPSTSDDDNP